MPMRIVKTFFVLALVLALTGCKPFKVTDPRDPAFDPLQFDFNDYKREGELAGALRAMLKPGMSKAEIEKILVVTGKAQVINQKESNDFGYALDHDPDFQALRGHASELILYRRGGGGLASGWFVYVFYDEAEHLIEIYEDSKKLFGTETTEGSSK